MNYSDTCENEKFGKFCLLQGLTKPYLTNLPSPSVLGATYCSQKIFIIYLSFNMWCQLTLLNNDKNLAKLDSDTKTLTSKCDVTTWPKVGQKSRWHSWDWHNVADIDFGEESSERSVKKSKQIWQKIIDRLEKQRMRKMKNCSVFCWEKKLSEKQLNSIRIWFLI